MIEMRLLMLTTKRMELKTAHTRTDAYKHAIGISIAGAIWPNFKLRPITLKPNQAIVQLKAR
jgi:hypothetical protein